MRKKKNILFILPKLPWPLNSGGNQAMFNGLASVKDVANIFITFPVSYINENDSKSLIEQLGASCVIEPFLDCEEISFWGRAIRKIYRFLETKFVKSKKDALLDKELSFEVPSNKFVEFVNNFICNHSIDIVQVEMLSMITIVNSLPSHVRKIFVHHELGYIRKEQLLFEFNANLRYKCKLDVYKIGEIGLLNKYDDIIVLSEIDKRKLEQEGVKVPIHASFAVVKSNPDFTPQIDDYHSLVFIGSSGHKPNLIAVNWFLENCWERLLTVDERFSLKVVGVWGESYSKPILKKYRNIIFKGFVEDLHGELKDAIMIVPITVGSGIRMKILEAANYGIPVVSTSIGAEGLPLINGENAFIADDATEFINSIIKLREKSIRIKFVKSLYEEIRDKYSLQSLSANRCQIMGL